MKRKKLKHLEKYASKSKNTSDHGVLQNSIVREQMNEYVATEAI